MIMNRMLFLSIFAILGALSYGWWYNDQRIIIAKQEEIQKFVNAGPRFTAQDGQELCWVIREIAKHSYGFQNSGLNLPDCNYGKK